VPRLQREEFNDVNSDEPPEPPERKSNSKAMARGREPALFYAVSWRADEKSGFFPEEGAPVGERVELSVTVTTTAICREPNTIYTVAFPLTVLPLPPTSFRWKFNMSRLIRQIGVLNRGYPLQPFLNNKRCEFAIDVSRKPVRVEDYLFVVDVELGEPIIPECVDPVSALVIVSVVFMTIFFLLTKDLDDY
jgi:hypothetical protein